MQSWQEWCSRPRDPNGIKVRSADAINRWTHDKHSSAITFYETYNMAHWGDALEANTTQEKDTRVISPTEAERLLGFPDDWTYLEATDAQTGAGHNRRKNAVGNAFAAPVITSLLVALSLCLEPAAASPTALWLDPSLPLPMYPDILDDLFTPALELAQEFKDLTIDFDNFMGTSWTHTLVGPDPGAAGRQNRSQRAAGLGNQAGTHLSEQGMPMLIPDNSPKVSMLKPKDHVAKALLLDHPFQTPPNYPRISSTFPWQAWIQIARAQNVWNKLNDWNS